MATQMFLPKQLFSVICSLLQIAGLFRKVQASLLVAIAVATRKWQVLINLAVGLSLLQNCRQPAHFRSSSEIKLQGRYSLSQIHRITELLRLEGSSRVRSGQLHCSKQYQLEQMAHGSA